MVLEGSEFNILKHDKPLPLDMIKRIAVFRAKENML